MITVESLGLKTWNDFITSEEELVLLEKIGGSKEKKKTSGRNSVRRFGSRLPYNSDVVSEKIPDFLVEISLKLVEYGCLETAPDSVSINEYFAGQGITPHIDSKSSGEVITILGLLGDAKMNFKNTRKGDASYSVPFPARSILQMRGRIRNEWMHEIPPVPTKRFSIVFRFGSK